MLEIDLDHISERGVLYENFLSGVRDDGTVSARFEVPQVEGGAAAEMSVLKPADLITHPAAVDALRPDVRNRP